MADSNITCSGLTATSGVGQLALRWVVTNPNAGGLPYLDVATVEVWAAASNDRAAAAKIGEGVDAFLHAGVPAGETRFYWVRARNVSNLYGEWHPVSPTAGVAGTAGTAQPGPGTITALELAPDSVTQPAIAPAAVGTTELADAAIVRAKIAYAAIGGAEIETATITNAHIVSLNANKIVAASLSAITANIGNLTGGTISGTAMYATTINGGTISGGTINGATINGGYLDVVEVTADNIYSVRFRTQTLGERIDMSLGQFLIYNSLLQNTIRLGASPFGSTPPMGVLTTNPSAFAARFENTSAGAIQAVSPTWGVYVSGGGGYGPFTGAHELLWPKDAPLPEPGDLIADRACVLRNGLSNTIFAAAYPDMGRPVVGPFVSEMPWMFSEEDEKWVRPAAMPDDFTDEQFAELRAEYGLILVNAVGEGQINVCDYAGPIRAGDLLIASGVLGKACAQEDDIIRSKTVAKAREDAVFDAHGRATIACIYVGG